MKAYWLNDGLPMSVQELRIHGIDYVRLDPDNYHIHFQSLKSNHNFLTQDFFELSSDTPDLDAMLATFGREHKNRTGVVRMVLAGSGMFDVRSHCDHWIRMEVQSGDCFLIPANRHHRLFVPEGEILRCARLFKSVSDLVPVYRPFCEAVLI